MQRLSRMRRKFGAVARRFRPAWKGESRPTSFPRIEAITIELDSGLVSQYEKRVPEKEEAKRKQDRGGEDEDEEECRVACAKKVVARCQWNKAGGRNERAAAGEIEQEEQEVAIVVEPHAVVDPGAVVIHFHHASVADAAMVRACGLWHTAFPTEAPALPVRLALRAFGGGFYCSHVVSRVPWSRQDARPVVEKNVEKHE
eukprot:scaffold6274_cov132-Isochrysis_galbana.AAC.2